MRVSSFLLRKTLHLSIDRAERLKYKRLPDCAGRLGIVLVMRKTIIVQTEEDSENQLLEDRHGEILGYRQVYGEK